MNPRRQLTPNRCRFLALAAICLLGISTAASAQGTRDPDLESQVQALCQSYLADFASAKTHLAYGRKINGPKGTAVLVPPAEVRQGLVRGKPVPYGYGSGIEDLALHNGHLLFALCDAYEATKNASFADTARRVFSGLRRLGSTSPVPGFVPRGPHPDDIKSYYGDSSLDQHTTFVYALWRYYRSELATPEDKAFIRQALASVGQRLEKNGWAIRVEDDTRIAHVGFSWLQATDVGAGTLLTVLAAIHDVTGDNHWRALYEKFGTERDGIRWKVLLDAGGGKRSPLTLYWNQFCVRDAVLSRLEKNPQRQAILALRWGEVTSRMLQGNVWEAWRRADWAPGDISGSVEVADEEAERRLGTIGLSLKQSATVFDLWDFYRRLAPQDRAPYWVQRLCVRMPMGSLHAALLSGQRDAVGQAAPRVREILKELDFKNVDSGETYYLAAVLGLHLVALQASEATATWPSTPVTRSLS